MTATYSVFHSHGGWPARRGPVGVCAEVPRPPLPPDAWWWRRLDRRIELFLNGEMEQVAWVYFDGAHDCKPGYEHLLLPCREHAFYFREHRRLKPEEASS